MGNESTLTGDAMFKWLTGGVTDTIGDIAKEWIETNKEKAEAQAVMIKALDPNGKMRRDIAMTICRLYTVYVILTVILILFQSFDVSTIVQLGSESHRSVDLAANSLKDLFTPITTLFTVITTASFGVNGMNSYMNKG